MMDKMKNDGDYLLTSKILMILLMLLSLHLIKFQFIIKLMTIKPHIHSIIHIHLFIISSTIIETKILIIISSPLLIIPLF